MTRELASIVKYPEGLNVLHENSISEHLMWKISRWFYVCKVPVVDESVVFCSYLINDVINVLGIGLFIKREMLVILLIMSIMKFN